MNPLARRLLLSGSNFHSRLANRFRSRVPLISKVRLTRRRSRVGIAERSADGAAPSDRRLHPDVIVSTYPRDRDAGRMPARGEISARSVSAITDLAALRSGPPRRRRPPHHPPRVRDRGTLDRPTSRSSAFASDRSGLYEPLRDRQAQGGLTFPRAAGRPRLRAVGRSAISPGPPRWRSRSARRP